MGSQCNVGEGSTQLRTQAVLVRLREKVTYCYLRVVFFPNTQSSYPTFWAVNICDENAEPLSFKRFR